MFEASLFESEGRIRAKNGPGIAIAATVQAIALSGLLLAPLFFPARLPRRVLQMTLTVPPPPMMPVLTTVPATTTNATSALLAVTQALVAPSIISHTHAGASGESAFDMPVSTGGAIGNGVDVSTLLSKLGGTPSTVHPAPAAPRGPVRISSGVMQGQMDSPIRPIYPSIARSARVQGTVVVAAIVSRTGAIEKLQVISGPMMLRQAALDAIQRAHYRPFKLNGEPVEVDTTISVVFALGDGR